MTFCLVFPRYRLLIQGHTIFQSKYRKRIDLTNQSDVSAFEIRTDCNVPRFSNIEDVSILFWSL